MKIVALVSDPNVSHTQWRVTRPLAVLKDASILSMNEWTNPDGIVWDSSIFQLHLEDYDVVVLPRVVVKIEDRVIFQGWINHLHNNNTVLIYETDDDVYSEAWADHWYRSSGSLITSELKRRESEENKWILNEVDGITTSTEHLAGVIRSFTDVPCIVIKNAIDVDAFNKGLNAKSQWEGKFTIGWAAGYRPESDSEDLAKAWAYIDKKYPFVEFVVAGWQPRNLVSSVPEYRLHLIPYTTMEDYPKGMQVTVGCCSVSDTLFNRSRGPGKAMEFALAGAAVVGTPLVYKDIINSPNFGQLATTCNEWVEALVYFIENKEAREVLQRNLKKRVETEFSLKNNIRRWTDVYKDLATLSTRTIQL